MYPSGLTQRFDNRKDLRLDGLNPEDLRTFLKTRPRYIPRPPRGRSGLDECPLTERETRNMLHILANWWMSLEEIAEHLDMDPRRLAELTLKKQARRYFVKLQQLQKAGQVPDLESYRFGPPLTL